MFKKLIILVVVVFAVYSVNAQNFENGDKALNVGIGLGGITSSVSLAPIPSFNASFEVGIVDIPNVGVVGVGGFGAFKTTWHDYGTYRYTYTRTIVAARGVFHFGFFDTGDFDLYAGLNAGVGFSKDAYNSTYYTGSTYSHFIHDEFIGARYMKNEKFGFFAELGYGISFLKAGITLKF